MQMHEEAHVTISAENQKENSIQQTMRLANEIAISICGAALALQHFHDRLDPQPRTGDDATAAVEEALEGFPALIRSLEQAQSNFRLLQTEIDSLSSIA